MSFSIAYQSRAKTEYELATQWYRERSESAAENFELAVQEKINILRTSPGRFKRSYKQFHEVALKRYPYSIIYLVNEHEKLVIISSIYHHSRNPKKKYKK